MDFNFETWYEICDDCRKIVDKTRHDGEWEKMEEIGACEYRFKRKKCGKPAIWEFFPIGRWN